jgi:hypothetical protein
LSAVVLLDLSQRMALTGSPAHNRGPCSSLDEALGGQDADVLRASITVVAQSLQALGLAIRQSPIQCIREQALPDQEKSARAAPTNGSRSGNTTQDRAPKSPDQGCTSPPFSPKGAWIPDGSIGRDVCNGAPMHPWRQAHHSRAGVRGPAGVGEL